jgi:hypothetical protein
MQVVALLGQSCVYGTCVVARRTATGLVQRHVKYGVKLEHYDQVLGVVAEFLTSGLTSLGAWDELQASAWTKLITLVKAVAAGQYTEAVSA